MVSVESRLGYVMMGTLVFGLLGLIASTGNLIMTVNVNAESRMLMGWACLAQQVLLFLLLITLAVLVWRDQCMTTVIHRAFEEVILDNDDDWSLTIDEEDEEGEEDEEEEKKKENKS